MKTLSWGKLSARICGSHGSHGSQVVMMGYPSKIYWRTRWWNKRCSAAMAHFWTESEAKTRRHEDPNRFQTGKGRTDLTSNLNCRKPSTDVLDPCSHISRPWYKESSRGTDERSQGPQISWAPGHVRCDRIVKSSSRDWVMMNDEMSWPQHCNTSQNRPV